MILELAADTPWRPLAQAPLIVGIGGSTHAGSTSEMLLRAVLTETARLGARTKLIAGPDAMLPLYAPNVSARDPLAHELIEALRICHGVVIASPGYHGSVSGMVKNALDYIEDLRTDTRPYLDGRAIGCIACAAGPQATGPVLAALRAMLPRDSKVNVYVMGKHEFALFSELSGSQFCHLVGLNSNFSDQQNATLLMPEPGEMAEDDAAADGETKMSEDAESEAIEW